MTKPALRKKIAYLGLSAVVLAETASHFLTNWMLVRYPEADPVDIIALCGTTPIPPMPLYLISAGGSALVVIVLCIAVSEKFAAYSGVFDPLVATGQLALTLYVAHVVIGMGLLEAMGSLDDQSIAMAVFSAVFFLAAAMAFAMFWRRFFERGPLEWAMRMITR